MVDPFGCQNLVSTSKKVHQPDDWWTLSAVSAWWWNLITTEKFNQRADWFKVSAVKHVNSTVVGGVTTGRGDRGAQVIDWLWRWLVHVQVSALFQ